MIRVGGECHQERRLVPFFGFERESDAAIFSSSEEASNNTFGVVLTRVGVIDPTVIQALRVLLSTDEEWNEAGKAIGIFAEEALSSNGPANVML